MKKGMTKKHKILAGIRVPLPRKTGGVHTPKTTYRRKRVKDALRQETKQYF